MFDFFLKYEYTFLVIITLIVAIISSELLRRAIQKFVKKSSAILDVDPTNYSFLKNAVSFIIYTFAFGFIIYSVPKFKTLGTTLFASAGIFAAIIALASQQAFANIVSGIFLVISKPFRVGDFVEINKDFKGTIEDITLRHTIVRDIQNNRILIPNTKMNSEILVNHHLAEREKKEKIEYYLSLDTDIEKAIDILKQVISKIPNYNVISDSDINEIPIFISKIDLGYVVLRAMVNSKDSETATDLHFQLNKDIFIAYQKAGIQFAEFNPIKSN